jgi:hypothetical protein
LPLSVSEKVVRTWLEQQIGERAAEIANFGLMTDVESTTMRASHNTGLALSKRNTSPSASADALSMCCFVSFADDEVAHEVFAALQGAKFENRLLNVQISRLQASEIIVAPSFLQRS